MGIACVVASIQARPCRADEERTATRSTLSTDAEAHLRQGIEHRKEHRDLEALEQFRLAEAIEPSARVRAQIGLAEQALGRWIPAESDLQSALEQEDGWVGEHRVTLEHALAYVQEHLAWLDIASNVDGAVLVVDGNVIGRLPLHSRLRTNAGTVRVHLEADGYVPAERTVAIAAGEHVEYLVQLAAKQGVSPDQRSSPSQQLAGSGALSWAGWGLIAGGAVGLGVGSAYGVQVLIEKAVRDENCSGQVCNDRGLSFDRTARRDATISSVGLGAGTVLAVLGLWMVWRSRHGESAVRVGAQSAQRRVGITLGVSW